MVSADKQEITQVVIVFLKVSTDKEEIIQVLIVFLFTL